MARRSNDDALPVVREFGDEHRLARLRSLGALLDNQFVLPGTGWRFGLDPIIGLVPGVGDLIGLGLSGWIVLEAIRLGVGPATTTRMLGNVAMDALTGVVPLVGDLFDFGWKANRRNLLLIERYVVEPHRVRRSSRAIVAGVLAATVAALVGVGFLLYELGKVIARTF